jgi:hypothetical protein
MIELQQGLHRAFDGLRDWNISSALDQEPVFQIGSHKQWMHKSIRQTYTLNLEFTFNVSDLLTARYVTSPYSPQWRQETVIGSYRPSHIEQSANMDTYVGGQLSVRVKYQIHDLNGFLDELNKAAWERYDRGLTKLIDGVLSTEDKN